MPQVFECTSRCMNSSKRLLIPLTHHRCQWSREADWVGVMQVPVECGEYHYYRCQCHCQLFQQLFVNSGPDQCYLLSKLRNSSACEVYYILVSTSSGHATFALERLSIRMQCFSANAGCMIPYLTCTLPTIFFFRKYR